MSLHGSLKCWEKYSLIPAGAENSENRQKPLETTNS